MARVPALGRLTPPAAGSRQARFRRGGTLSGQVHGPAPRAQGGPDDAHGRGDRRPCPTPIPSPPSSELGQPRCGDTPARPWGQEAGTSGTMPKLMARPPPRRNEGGSHGRGPGPPRDAPHGGRQVNAVAVRLALPRPMPATTVFGRAGSDASPPNRNRGSRVSRGTSPADAVTAAQGDLPPGLAATPVFEKGCLPRSAPRGRAAPPRRRALPSRPAAGPAESAAPGPGPRVATRAPGRVQPAPP